MSGKLGRAGKRLASARDGGLALRAHGSNLALDEAVCEGRINAAGTLGLLELRGSTELPRRRVGDFGDAQRGCISGHPRQCHT